MDNLNYQAMGFWWMVALTISNMGTGLYLFWERHNNATSSRIKHLEEDMDRRLDHHAQKLAQLDEHIKHVPTDQDLSRLHSRIDGLVSEFKELTGEFKGANHMLKVIHQHMLDRIGQ